jgi:hypothetical protein
MPKALNLMVCKWLVAFYSDIEKLVSDDMENIVPRCSGGCGGPSNSLRIRKNFPEVWIFETYDSDE